MDGLASSIRGDGLMRLQIALARLEREPLRLDRERQRFNRSPPLYKSKPPSVRTTPSTGINSPSEEQKLRKERLHQLYEEREASMPHKQFKILVVEEQTRIWKSNPRTCWTERHPADDTFGAEARETVKKRWVGQGIWNDKWNQFASGRWKHDEPLEVESESEMDSEARASSPLASPSLKPQPKPRQLKSDDAKQRRAIRERECEASRPYGQFVYQISKKRESMQKELENGKEANTYDINTRAYEDIKNTWMKRRIWNTKWGILPGMSWKHEEPFDEAADPAPVPASPLLTSRHKARPKPKVASNRTTRSSAKPQGVSKRQPAKTTRGKGRKK